MMRIFSPNVVQNTQAAPARQAAPAAIDSAVVQAPLFGKPLFGKKDKSKDSFVRTISKAARDAERSGANHRAVRVAEVVGEKTTGIPFRAINDLIHGALSYVTGHSTKRQQYWSDPRR